MQVETEISGLPSEAQTALMTAGRRPATSIGEILLALATPTNGSAFADLVTGSVSRPPTCGDGVCGPGETPIAALDPTELTCAEDCPFTYGTCGSPGSNDVGDPTKVRPYRMPILEKETNADVYPCTD